MQLKPKVKNTKRLHNIHKKRTPRKLFTFRASLIKYFRCPTKTIFVVLPKFGKTVIYAYYHKDSRYFNFKLKPFLKPFFKFS